MTTDLRAAIEAHASNIRRWVLSTNWATTDIAREAEAILALLDAAPAPGLDVERLATILRDERDAVPRGPTNYWQGYRDGLETAMRRLETDFALAPSQPEDR